LSEHESRSLESMIVHVLYRAVQEADAVFVQHVGEAGLTPRQFAVLVTVAQQENANQTHLVVRTGMDRSTVSDVVRRLVGHGLLQRRRTKEDARAYAIRLTDKGQETLRAVEPRARRADVFIQSLLPPKQRREVLAGLQMLVSAFELTAARNAAKTAPAGGRGRRTLRNS